MAFNLRFLAERGIPLNLPLSPGEALFVVGPNGSGKSSLLHYIHAESSVPKRWVMAHRQTSIEGPAVSMTMADRRQFDQEMGKDIEPSARYIDPFAHRRIQSVLYDIVVHENARNEEAMARLQAGNSGAAQEISNRPGPLGYINSLLKNANIPITISRDVYGGFLARKNGAEQSYGVDQMSDGERAILLLAGAVLTAPEGALVLIDEPERHLHRAIRSPMLEQLVQRRADCGFVIATHDITLPPQSPQSKVVLLRGCTMGSEGVGTSWDADVLPAGTQLPDHLKQDILGARRQILFVEGGEGSVDSSLWT